MKLFSYKSISFVVAFMVLFTSCIFDNSITGNGNVVNEKRIIDQFDKVHASGGLKVYVTFGEDSNEIEVVADENLHEVIVTEVRGGELQIKTNQGIRSAKAKDVYVKVKTLKSIDVSSAADLRAENKLITDKLDIDVSSAADLELELVADKVSVDVSSSGEASLAGSADELSANVSSAGDLDASDLVSKRCRVDVSSAGDVRVHATDELVADASSAGNVTYYGNPETKRIKSSSAGKVREK